ncbi:hypothetical protein GCM10027067_35940 [Pseudactinotalea suaedae]
MFPSPTAEPIAARMNTVREENAPLRFSASVVADIGTPSCSGPATLALRAGVDHPFAERRTVEVAPCRRGARPDDTRSPSRFESFTIAG